MKIILRPGKMSAVYSIDKAQRITIKNWSGTNCKASATFYPAKKGQDTVDFENDTVLLPGGQFDSVSFYWIDCSDDELSFDFETE